MPDATQQPVRIAMWSGPRNISTAMMRSWENRPDTAVWDEPFYACYLGLTGVDHPGRDETLAAYEKDWRKVADAVVAPPPNGAQIHYQKHMTHHMVPGIGLDWMRGLRHAFLIRDPADVILSYLQRRPHVAASDLGFERQTELFEHVVGLTGTIPPVIDADDVLRDPRGTLTLLCEALDVPFVEHMLAWPPGPRDTDGTWAPYWYDTVQVSTRFAPYKPRVMETPEPYLDLEASARVFYERMARHCLRPTPEATNGA